MLQATTLYMLMIASAAPGGVKVAEKAALPPDLRKASGFSAQIAPPLSPVSAGRLSLPVEPGELVRVQAVGRGKPFRRSGGRAARVRYLSAALTSPCFATPLFSTNHSSTPGNAGARAQTARGGKLIALTFDDGPKPYVLMGTRSGKGIASQSLLGLLDQQGVKATFFVMGWRLSENADAKCRHEDGGVCREAAEEEHRRGHEIENHTYGHGNFRIMVKRYGEEWVLNDIERASTIIQRTTGEKPTYLRPPDWTIWPELEQKIEARGYHVMTKSSSVPLALRDVDSEDYFCAGRDVTKCPKPSDYDYVLRAIAQRERQGVEQHILVFHELPQSVELLSRLIPELKKRGYGFVPLRKYMAQVSG
jgi:peptidoglycan/xylan/chitin deacetylase (PgdA/CDA1 family)